MQEFKGQIIVDNEICVFPFSEYEFTIEYDSFSNVWEAIPEDTDKFDYHIIIDGEIMQDNEKVLFEFKEDIELFNGFILTKELFEELKGVI